MLHDNIGIGENGRLTFAGQDTVALCEQYGTPLMLLDENRVRGNMSVYVNGMKKHFTEDSHPLLASKALCFKGIYKIAAEEGMYTDIVSTGELYVAKSAGFPMENAFFHGSNKSDAAISMAMDMGLGWFIVDNREELDEINRQAGERGIVQNILLRLTPGIDPHTYEAIATGKVDSKFGSAIETGQAEEIVVYTLAQPHIELMGYHCHVGSQVFGEDIFERAAVVMLEFLADMRDKHGFTAPVLDLGGGYGVRYTEDDPYLDIETKVGEVAKAIKDACVRLNLEVPEIHMEPGRSIVADAGMTLYTVGTVKQIPGYKNYVSIDGSMADHIRFALYGSKYTCLLANKMNEAFDFEASVVGRCCESGDIIQEHVMMPSSVGRYDTMAVCTTGAYHYSMASNYNMLPKPPIVMLKGGENYLAVKRQTFEELCMSNL